MIESKTTIIAPHLGVEKHVRYKLEHLFSVKSPEFLRSMGHMLGPGIISGNKIKALQNGDQIFPAMLNAIKMAKKSISFETYVYWAGDIGQKFYQALSERSLAGVKVHIILDWIGTERIDKKYTDNSFNRI